MGPLASSMAHVDDALEQEPCLMGQVQSAGPVSWAKKVSLLIGVIGLATLGALLIHVKSETHPSTLGSLGYLQNKVEVPNPSELIFWIKTREKESRMVMSSGACMTKAQWKDGLYEVNREGDPNWRIQPAIGDDPPIFVTSKGECLFFHSGIQVKSCKDVESNKLLVWDKGIFKVKNGPPIIMCCGSTDITAMATPENPEDHPECHFDMRAYGPPQ